MPQLSPMLGIMVFILTNSAFLTVVMSVRPYLPSSPSTANSSKKGEKAFRSFS